MAKTSLGKVSVLPKGEYSSVIQYSRLDIVTYKGSSYLCIKDSLGIEITNEEYWQLLAQKGDTGETGATGAKGDKGDAGKDFSIYKTYPSISAMESDASNVPEGEFVLIASDVEDTDNAKLYVKSNTGFVYLTDLSGATGIKGEKGDKPINGVDYNTPEEKEEFKNEVVENATVEVEQNIANIQEQAIQKFNSNASTKTNEYNSNTTTKLQEYNTNANTKIEEYNSNATQKTNTFNGNATTQIETFNNNATSKTNDFNSNASTKTEEFNAVVDEEKEQFAGQTEAINHHIAVVSDELERVKNDVLETGEESGSYITLNDSAMAEYQELSAEGVCDQETTKMTYKCTGEESGDYYFAYNDINYQFTMPTITSSSILVFDTSTLKLTLNSTEITTSTGTAGTLLTFLNTPNPDYPQEIKTIENSLKITSCNKNLFDKNNSILMNKYYTSNGNIQYSEDTFIQEKYIEVEPNTNYTFSASFVTDYFRMVEYDESKNFIEKKMVSNPVLKVTYTTTNNTKYIRVSCSNNNLDTLQIEKGTQETPYEQHLETQIQANLPEGEFIGKINDTYKDTLKVEYNEEDGQYHLNLYKSIAKVVLDGSEHIEKEGVETDITQLFAVYDCQGITQGNGEIKSNYFIYNRNSWGNDKESIRDCSKYTANSCWIRIKKERLNGNTVNSFKNWLSTNKPIVYYSLEIPYTVDLGIVDMPLTYNEITNLFTDSDLMPTINAKYYRNFITTIQNLQVNEKALKEELVDINSRLSALESATTNVASESEVVE